MALRKLNDWTDSYQTVRLLVGAAYIFLGPLVLLGWPPDFAHRWWALIPLAIVGVALFVTFRNLRKRRYTEKPLNLSEEN